MSNKWIFIIFFILGLFLSGNGYSKQIDWSVIIYAATDEEDLAHHADPIISKIFDMKVPTNVELLIENDTFTSNNVKRLIKVGSQVLKQDILPEADSASVEHFTDFLNWARNNSSGTNKLLLFATHSWGWKGIIQDYTVPGKPKVNTMMPIRVFSKAIKDSSLNPDIIFLDACILGVAELIEDMKNVTPYLLLSQRETPYGGFPIEALYNYLKYNSQISPLELAKLLPQGYVEAYSNKGYMSPLEGEYDIVTSVAVDTSKWDYFADKFTQFVDLLKEKNLRGKLQEHPKWFNKIADGDYNVDLVEMFERIPEFMGYDSEVLSASDSLLSIVGYPKDVLERSGEKLIINNSKIKAFKLYLEADKYLAQKFPENDKLLEEILKKWEMNNTDLIIHFPKSVTYEIEDLNSKKYFVVKSSELTKSFELRPWLPGVLQIEFQYLNSASTWVRKPYSRNIDYFSVNNFPLTSFLIAEAHTQGAPFIHGIGIMLKPNMSENEVRGTDSITGLKGPNFYEIISWNKRTHWGDLILLNLNMP